MNAMLQSENVKQVAKIFEENSDMIRVAIRSQVNDKSIINDIFQSLFVSLVHRPVPPDIENMEGYLRRAVENDVIDAAIKRKYRRVREWRYSLMYSIHIKYYSPEDTAVMSDVIQHIFNIIEIELPAYEARALIQKFRYDKDDDEAAKALGIAKSTLLKSQPTKKNTRISLPKLKNPSSHPKNPQNPILHIFINAKKLSKQGSFSQKSFKKLKKVKKRQIF